MSALLLALAYLLWGFIVASIITGVLWIVVDYRRWSREFDRISSQD